MTRLWLFLHLLGFTMWLGGGIASMFAGIAAKGEDRAGLGAVVRAQAAVQRIVLSPGAVLTLVTGVMLTLRMVGMAVVSGWLMVMQGAGLIAVLVTLFVMLPTSARLRRIDPTGPDRGYFDELRTRMRVAGMISGTLGLIALAAGVFMR